MPVVLSPSASSLSVSGKGSRDRGGVFPCVSRGDPRLLIAGAVRAIVPHKKYLLKSIPLFGSICLYYTTISVTLVTSIKIFQQNAGNAFFFPPTIQ